MITMMRNISKVNPDLRVTSDVSRKISLASHFTTIDMTENRITLNEKLLKLQLSIIIYLNYRGNRMAYCNI